ncbi:MAG: SDR family oxidoreductase [Myxococcales bacterium]|nr:SDR family oxidoreductase [Myxococcales bacterium]
MAIESVDMTGKQVMITGCTAGLGRAAAIALAEMGATLSLVCRNRSKGEALIEEIRRKTGREDCELYVGDMGSRRDIRSIAAAYIAKDRPLDVLFNNAGVVMQQRSETVDGFETTFGVNHLGYFLLTVLLLEPLKAATAGRVVSTASDAYKFGGRRMNFDDLQSERKYSTFGAYGASKLANILFSRELARRVGNSNVTVNAFHPGMVGSDFAKNNGWIAQVAMTLIRPIARSPLKGAESGIYLCTSPEVEGRTGGYYFDCAIRDTRPAARNDEDALRLWEVSEKLTGASLA